MASSNFFNFPVMNTNEMEFKTIPISHNVILTKNNQDFISFQQSFMLYFIIYF